MRKPQPMQPLYRDSSGSIRFQENGIVRFLLDWCTNRGVNLNTLAMMNFTSADREQFAQLIGYSLGGFGELSYVRDKTYAKAEQLAEKLKEKEADSGSRE